MGWGVPFKQGGLGEAPDQSQVSREPFVPRME